MKVSERLEQIENTGCRSGDDDFDIENHRWLVDRVKRLTDALESIPDRCGTGSEAAHIARKALEGEVEALRNQGDET